MVRQAMMRYVLPVIVLVSSMAAMPEAAELKIGFIDSEKIFAEYQATSVAQAEFEADIQKWNQELETRKRDLEKMTEDFESQRLILSKAKQASKQAQAS